MVSPKFLLYLLGPLFGVTRKFVVKNVGYALRLNNSKSKNKLGLSYTPIESTVKDMADKMEELKIV